jgi:hypothetical protein
MIAQVAPFFTLPIPFMIMWDWPREGSVKALLYQFFITVTTWMWYVSAISSHTLADCVVPGPCISQSLCEYTRPSEGKPCVDSL